MLSTNNICLDMTDGMYHFAITDRTMCVLPPHHTFCSTIIFVGHFAQGCTIYLSSGLKYLLPELKEQKPTHLVLVPLFIETLYKRIWQTAEKTGKADTLRKGIKLSASLRKLGIDRRRSIFKDVLDTFGGEVKMIICGGAALNQDIIDFFDAIGITILNGYGITECAPLISCNRNEYQKKDSVGIPIVDEEVRILDPDENGEGEICVKGTNVMLGYFNDPEATAAAFTEDGYFRTGDYGKLDLSLYRSETATTINEFDLDDPTTWIRIVMHLKDDAQPIHHFDVQAMARGWGQLPNRLKLCKAHIPMM